MQQEDNLYEKYKRKLIQAETDHQQNKRSTRVTKVYLEEDIEEILANEEIKKNISNDLKLSLHAPTWAKEINEHGNI